MTNEGLLEPKRLGRTTDARGRSVSQLDPVKLHLLNQRTVIPAKTLRSMADQIMPGARRQRLVQVLSVALGFIVVVGGTIIYFRYFSTWKGFDPVNVTIYVVQVVVILSAPLLVFRMARAKYVNRVASVMLQHCHCPHCGYDLRELSVHPDDGATICPECGCAWRLDDSHITELAAARPIRPRSHRVMWIMATAVLGVGALVLIAAMYFAARN